jgi:Bifunctional DNA primase/polymerase, N-terminal
MAPRFQVDLDESIPPLAAIVEEGVPGPFRDAAPDLLARGLAVVPCGSADGKVPLVEWGKWTKRPGLRFVEKLMRRHPSANIGIVTGCLSGITLVDCDGDVDVMIACCGDTPLKVRTPRGGVHLYYRFAGERCADLRTEGLKVDVKAAGGFAVVPPSVRPDGPYAGRAYEFLAGSWGDLSRLPAARPGSLPAVEVGMNQPARLRAVRACLKIPSLGK